jgi:hypothetical protein
VYFREDASEFGSIVAMGRVIHVTRTVIAHHLIFTGYGHWLGNDPRGSGSSALRVEKFEALGPIHFGRKIVQPSKEELRAFYRDAEQLLDHETIWFDAPMRAVIADAFGKVIKDSGYTAYAGAVLQNHAHDLNRVHRDKADEMWEKLAVASRDALRAERLVPKDHPVWSNRPYVVFKTTVRSVENCVGYINDNFQKHGLPLEIYPWITPYDGWPHQRKR